MVVVVVVVMCCDMGNGWGLGEKRWGMATGWDGVRRGDAGGGGEGDEEQEGQDRVRRPDGYRLQER
jgi:hypothetical protein